MNSFNLQIVTPDGLFFDGNCNKIVVRTLFGDVGILNRHVDYVAPIGIGKARVWPVDSKMQIAAVAGGMVSFSNNHAVIVATTFEWAKDIDIKRAEKAAEAARQNLESKQTYEEIKLLSIRLKRALNRINVYNEGRM